MTIDSAADVLSMLDLVAPTLTRFEPDDEYARDEWCARGKCAPLPPTCVIRAGTVGVQSEAIVATKQNSESFQSSCIIVSQAGNFFESF